MNNFVDYKLIFDDAGNYEAGAVTQIDLICQPDNIAKQAVPRLYDTSVTPPVLVEKPSENTVTYLHIYDCSGSFVVVDETMATFSSDYIITCDLCKYYPFGIDPNGDPNLYLNQTGQWTPTGGGGGYTLLSGQGISITGTSTKTISMRNGLNYWYLFAQSNKFVNGGQLVDLYNLAKIYNPNGNSKDDTNRLTIVLYPGQYEVTDTLILDTPYIDLVSITGEADVIISCTNSNTVINVNTSDVKLKGLNFSSQALQIEDVYWNTYYDNIKGGTGCFTSPYGGGWITGNFKNCIGGDYSFADSDNSQVLFYAQIENCTSGSDSFGWEIQSSILKNCTSYQSSFGLNTIRNNSELYNCSAGDYSFGVYGGIYGSILTDCKAQWYSFGRTDITSVNSTIDESILTNCRAFEYSFGVDNKTTSTFINCTGGYQSFGANFANSTYRNCIGDTNCFGSSSAGFSDLQAGGTFYNCQAGDNSFGTNYSNGNFFNCIAGSNGFIGTVQSGMGGYAAYCKGMNANGFGTAIYCIDSANNPINYGLGSTTNNI